MPQMETVKYMYTYHTQKTQLVRNAQNAHTVRVHTFRGVESESP